MPKVRAVGARRGVDGSLASLLPRAVNQREIRMPRWTERPVRPQRAARCDTAFRSISRVRCRRPVRLCQFTSTLCQRCAPIGKATVPGRGSGLNSPSRRTDRCVRTRAGRTGRPRANDPSRRVDTPRRRTSLNPCRRCTDTTCPSESSRGRTKFSLGTVPSLDDSRPPTRAASCLMQGTGCRTLDEMTPCCDSAATIVRFTSVSNGASAPPAAQRGRR
jgi:hypothetical protein